MNRGKAHFVRRGATTGLAAVTRLREAASKVPLARRALVAALGIARMRPVPRCMMEVEKKGISMCLEEGVVSRLV